MKPYIVANVVVGAFYLFLFMAVACGPARPGSGKDSGGHSTIYTHEMPGGVTCYETFHGLSCVKK